MNNIYLTELFRTVVPTHFGTRDQFHERQFFHKLVWRGWLWDDESALHLLSILFLVILYKSHLRSSGIRPWRLDIPAFENEWNIGHKNIL